MKELKKKEPLLISKVVVYRTPSENAKANFSVGLSVTNRLNGDECLVGTFNPDDNDERMVGFLTFREKFDDEDEAKKYRKKMRKRYRAGSPLPSGWTWGEVDLVATEILDTNASVHFVEYRNKAITGAKEIVKAKNSKELKFKGKVTEPV